MPGVRGYVCESEGGRKSVITPTTFAAALLAQAVLFAALLTYLLWTHARERAALLDRLMARDWGEYRAAQDPEPKRDGPHNPIARHRRKHYEDRMADFKPE